MTSFVSFDACESFVSFLKRKCYIVQKIIHNTMLNTSCRDLSAKLRKMQLAKFKFKMFITGKIYPNHPKSFKNVLNKLKKNLLMKGRRNAPDLTPKQGILLKVLPILNVAVTKIATVTRMSR